MHVALFHSLHPFSVQEKVERICTYMFLFTAIGLSILLHALPFLLWSQQFLVRRCPLRVWEATQRLLVCLFACQAQTRCILKRSCTSHYFKVPQWFLAVIMFLFFSFASPFPHSPHDAKLRHMYVQNYYRFTYTYRMSERAHATYIHTHRRILCAYSKTWRCELRFLFSD